MLYLSIILGSILNMISGGQFRSKDWLPVHPRYFSGLCMGFLFYAMTISAAIGVISGLSYFIYRFLGWRWFNSQPFLDIGFVSGNKVAEYFMMASRGAVLAIAPLLALAFSIPIGLHPVVVGLGMAFGSASGYLLGNYISSKSNLDGIVLAEAIAGAIAGGLLYGVFV